MPPPVRAKKRDDFYRDRRRRKVCAFCADKTVQIDYKEVNRLRRYLSERAKIEPRRKTGTCAGHQRMLTTALKRARHLALLPFTEDQLHKIFLTIIVAAGVLLLIQGIAQVFRCILCIRTGEWTRARSSASLTSCWEYVSLMPQTGTDRVRRRNVCNPATPAALKRRGKDRFERRGNGQRMRPAVREGGSPHRSRRDRRRASSCLPHGRGNSIAQEVRGFARPARVARPPSPRQKR